MMWVGLFYLEQGRLWQDTIRRNLGKRTGIAETTITRDEDKCRLLGVEIQFHTWFDLLSHQV